MSDVIIYTSETMQDMMLSLEEQSNCIYRHLYHWKWPETNKT